MEDLTGFTIGGQFEILEPIGKGAMAMVYRAYQASMDRIVAVKMLLGEYTRESDFLERFEQEARVTARLSHIHILPIYHYDQFAGKPYLVVPFIDTGTLAERLESGPMPIEETLRLGSQLASALDYAHGRSVIHRDVKPSNVLIDDDNNALLSDFGLAKLISLDAASLGTGEMLIGTPDYMSPEQCGGLPADTRSDVYALAVIFYEMLTGSPPFVAASPFTTILNHINAPIPDLPPALTHLDPVIKKGLAKDPDQRYQSAGEMIEAFHQMLNTDAKLDSDQLYAPITQGLNQTAPLLDEEISTPVQVSMSQVPALLDRLYSRVIGEANRLTHGYLGVEHVFIALVRSPDDPAHHILQRVGIAPLDIIHAIDRYVGRGDGPLFKGGPRPTPRLMHVLQIAYGLASQEHRFSPTHQELFVAMLQEGDSVPIRTLYAMGVNLPNLLDLLLDVQSTSPAVDGTSQPSE